MQGNKSCRLVTIRKNALTDGCDHVLLDLLKTVSISLPVLRTPRRSTALRFLPVVTITVVLFSFLLMQGKVSIPKDFPDLFHAERIFVHCILQ